MSSSANFGALIGFGTALLTLLGFAVASGYLLFDAYDFNRRAVQTEGVVVEHRYAPATKGKGSYHPVVRFSARDGQPVEFEDSYGSNPAPYEIGDRVQVLYDAEQPDRARVYSSFWSIWLLPVSFGAVTLFTALFIAIVALLLRRRARPSGADARFERLAERLASSRAARR